MESVSQRIPEGQREKQYHRGYWTDRQGENQYHRGIELDGWTEIQEALNQTDGQREIQSVSQRPGTLTSENSRWSPVE